MSKTNNNKSKIPTVDFTAPPVAPVTSKSNKVTMTTLRKQLKAIQEEKSVLSNSLTSETVQVNNLSKDLDSQKYKLSKIVSIISDRFDNDGVNDLNLIGKKITVWTILMNLSGVAKMIKEIIAVLSDKPVTL